MEDEKDRTSDEVEEIGGDMLNWSSGDFIGQLFGSLHFFLFVCRLIPT